MLAGSWDSSGKVKMSAKLGCKPSAIAVKVCTIAECAVRAAARHVISGRNNTCILAMQFCPCCLLA